MELDLIDMNFFSHPSGGTGRNVIIFWVDMNSYTKTDNKKKDILMLGKGPTQGLEHSVQEKYIQLILPKIIKHSVWACIRIKEPVIYLLIMVEIFINLKHRILKL